MFLKEIQFKNIGSYGDSLYTLNFSREGEMIQLKGLSGSGKSTILSLPTLLFYGKLQGTNKTSIANRSNKNGYIRGTVLSRDKEYVIERGFSPTYLNLFEVSPSGELLDIQNIGSKDGQSFIEDNIIGLTSQMFNSLISLNLNTFKSFITMNNQEKKQIIDKLFNLDVVNIVYQMIRDNTRALNQTILKHQSAIEALSNTIRNTENQILAIKNSNASLADKQKELLSPDKISELTSLSESLNTDLSSINESYNKVNSEYDKLKSKDSLFSKAYNSLSIQKTQVQRDLQDIESKLRLFSQSKCPTCSADFSSSYFQDIKTKLEAAKIDALTKLDALKLQESNYQSNKTKYNVMLDEMKSKVNNIKKQSNDIQARIKNIFNILSSDTRLRSNLKISDWTPLKKILDDTKTDIEKIQQEIEINNKELFRYSILEPVYSENGIKSTIIGSYIPQINSEVQKSLINFSFPYLLEFDVNFNAHLFHLGEEIPLNTLSAGELKRTDIAVLCSLLKLVKQKYPDINFVSFDETLSSIDTQTADDIVRYLNQFSKDENLSIIIVSHAPLNNESIDKIISVKKPGIFSEIEIELPS